MLYDTPLLYYNQSSVSPVHSEDLTLVSIVPADGPGPKGPGADY